MLGHPIAHSLSPVLHRAAYRVLGLGGWTYEAVDVVEADLPAFLHGLDPDTWAGLSLTMPLKRAVRPLLTGESRLAAEVGAVNTVLLGPRGPVGDNTDVHGIVAALREAGVHRAPRAAVLGGGATAASAVAALRELGCREPVVHVRSAARVGDLLGAAERLGVHPRLESLDAPSVAGSLGRGVDVVVSTLPPGAADDLADQILGQGTPAGVPARGVSLPPLLDVVYDPWPTPLARAWQRAGAPVVSGFAMLLHQAAAQVALMTGRVAPVDAMRAAGNLELARRAPLQEAGARAPTGSTPAAGGISTPGG